MIIMMMIIMVCAATKSDFTQLTRLRRITPPGLGAPLREAPGPGAFKPALAPSPKSLARWASHRVARAAAKKCAQRMRAPVCASARI